MVNGLYDYVILTSYLQITIKRFNKNYLPNWMKPPVDYVINTGTVDTPKKLLPKLFI